MFRSKFLFGCLICAATGLVALQEAGQVLGHIGLEQGGEGVRT